jgi:hypothetical protein
MTIAFHAMAHFKKAYPVQMLISNASSSSASCSSSNPYLVGTFLTLFREVNITDHISTMPVLNNTQEVHLV